MRGSYVTDWNGCSLMADEEREREIMMMMGVFPLTAIAEDVWLKK